MTLFPNTSRDYSTKPIFCRIIVSLDACCRLWIFIPLCNNENISTSQSFRDIIHYTQLLTHPFQINEFLLTLGIQALKMNLDNFFWSIIYKRLINRGGNMNSFFKKRFRSNNYGNFRSVLLLRLPSFSIVSHPIPNLVLNQNYFVDSECHLKFVFNHAMCAFSDLNLSIITSNVALMEFFSGSSRSMRELKRFFKFFQTQMEA